MVMMMAFLLLVPTIALGDDHGDHPEVSTPAADLRADLDHLLSEHFVLAVLAMQKGYDEAEDWEEVEWALDENTTDMVVAIESLYGEEGAEEFDRIFRAHNDYTEDIVAATLENDEEARAAAEEEVEEFVIEFAAFLDEATEGNLPQEAAEEAIRAHEADVLNAFDHYVAEDYEAAYTSFREGFDRMFDISEALSGAIVAQMPEEFDHTEVSTPASDLRSTLNHLASEHFALASIELQKGYDQAADFDFVTWAEDMHTADFKAAIESVYGSEGADEFERIWEEYHILAQSDLAIATLEDDEEGREQAIEDLRNFSMEFGAFLGEATEENLPTEDAQDAIWSHEEQVIDTFDSYAEASYTDSYETFREGYAFMYGIGETLGGAIVTQMADEFEEGGEMPDEMPQTGLGGGSSNDSNMISWVMMSVLLAAASIFFIRKKAVQ